MAAGDCIAAEAAITKSNLAIAFIA